VRVDGTVEELGSTGPVLGAFEEVHYEMAEVQLARGDLLFLYTDGLTEARRDKELYGENRVFQLLSSFGGERPYDAVGAVIEDVIGYADNRLRDDLALLAVRWLGPDDGPETTPRP
jgi:phosphoserine phosphatase RsbU/P